MCDVRVRVRVRPIPNKFQPLWTAYLNSSDRPGNTYLDEILRGGKEAAAGRPPALLGDRLHHRHRDRPVVAGRAAGPRLARLKDGRGTPLRGHVVLAHVVVGQRGENVQDLASGNVHLPWNAVLVAIVILRTECCFVSKGRRGSTHGTEARGWKGKSAEGGGVRARENANIGIHEATNKHHDNSGHIRGPPWWSGLGRGARG